MIFPPLAAAAGLGISSEELLAVDAKPVYDLSDAARMYAHVRRGGLYPTELQERRDALSAWRLGISSQRA